ncbi:MAG: T9SS type A sorting domain-containing protein [Flavobacteriaceae bacterium]|nr:T9SS type A sorting domain-containing protein [Flavobacteriaceae bacterium]
MKNIYLILVSVGLLFSSSMNAQVPPNDTVGGATDITAQMAGGSFTATNIQFQNATTASNGGNGGCNLGSTITRLYFKYTPTADAQITVTISTPAGTSLVVPYTAANANATTDAQLTAAPGAVCAVGASSSINIFSGTVYYFAIGNSGGASDVVFTETTQAPPPPNDQIINAVDITPNMPNFVDVAVDLQAATVGPGGAMAGCDVNAANLARVYYKYLPTTNGTLIVDIGTPIPGAFAIGFTAANLNAQNDQDLTGIAGESLCAVAAGTAFTLTANQAYYILVGNPGQSDVEFNFIPDFGGVRPPNDLIQNRIEVFGLNFTDPNVAFPLATALNTTVNPGGTGGQTGCSTGNVRKIYYELNTIAAGNITVTLSDPAAAGPSFAIFYTSTTIGGPTVDADLDLATGAQCQGVDAQGQVVFAAQANTTYFLLVSNERAYSDVNITTPAGVLNTAEFEQQSFKLFPSPAREILNIESNFQMESVQIYDINGKLLDRISINENTLQLNVINYSTGLYFAKILTSDGKVITRRFVKE